MKSVLRAGCCAVSLAASLAPARAAEPQAPDPGRVATDEGWQPIPGEPSPERAGPDTSPPPSDRPSAEERRSTNDEGGWRDDRTPDGRWVYTSQYGWVWMPYASDYAYAPAGVSEPLMYVYGPSFGWAWVGAPWLWGWGPTPYLWLDGGFYAAWHYPRYGWWGYGHGWGGHRWGGSGWRGPAWGGRVGGGAPGWNGWGRAPSSGAWGGSRGPAAGPRAAPPRATAGPRGGAGFGGRGARR